MVTNSELSAEESGRSSPDYRSEKQEHKKPLLVKKKDPKLHVLLPDVKVYKRRWIMLFVFSVNTMINGILFMGLSPISNIVAPYYKVDPVLIEWLSNMYMLVYIFIALPSAFAMSKWGIRPILIIVAALDTAATAMHFTGYRQENFHFVIIGQIFAAIAFGNVVQIPGKLSATWFPENERATATSIGVFMNIFGVAVGFLQPSHMIKSSMDITVIENGLKQFFLSQLILCSIVFFITFTCYREEPPIPPSKLVRNIEEPSFFQTLKVLAKNPYFFLMSQCYGIYYGLYVTISVLLNPIVTSRFPNGYESEIGWMGFGCDSAAILSCFLIGIWLDHYHGYQAMSILLNSCSTIVWLSFILIFLKTDSFSGLFIMITTLGVVGIPYFACGIEQAAEMTYPVPEGTSSAVLLTLGNFYGFVMILVLGKLLNTGHVLTVLMIILGCYLLSTILSVCARTELKRKNAEQFAEQYAEKRIKKNLGKGWVNINFKKNEI